MPERKITPGREKKRQALQAENPAGTHEPKEADPPEQEVQPEFEGDPLQSEGETTESEGDRTRRIINPKKSK